MKQMGLKKFKNNSYVSMVNTLKKFIFRFITVPAKWIKSGRQRLLRLYTSKDYTPLRG
jgi:hypothetical protein